MEDWQSESGNDSQTVATVAALRGEEHAVWLNENYILKSLLYVGYCVGGIQLNRYRWFPCLVNQGRQTDFMPNRCEDAYVWGAEKERGMNQGWQKSPVSLNGGSSKNVT